MPYTRLVSNLKLPLLDPSTGRTCTNFKLSIILQHYRSWFFSLQMCSSCSFFFSCSTQILRNDSRGIWFDYNLITETNSVQFVASNFTPLFTNSFDSSLQKYYGERAADYLLEEEIIQSDGTPRYYCNRMFCKFLHSSSPLPTTMPTEGNERKIDAREIRNLTRIR